MADEVPEGWEPIDHGAPEGWEPIGQEGSVFDPKTLAPPSAQTVGPQPNGTVYYDPSKAVDAPVRGAGYAANLVASMTPDIAKKKAYYESMTGIPASSMLVDPEGNLAHVDRKTGEVIRFEPTIGAGSIARPVELAQRIGHQAAANARPIADAMAGMVGDVAGGLPGAFIAPALSDLMFQSAGSQLAPAVGDKLVNPDAFGRYESLRDISPLNAAGQGLASGLGSAVMRGAGSLVNSIFESNPLRAAGADIDAMQSNPALRRDILDLANLGEKFGITLTPANLSGLRSLQNMERRLAYRVPTSIDTLNSMYAARNGLRDIATPGEIPAAVGKVADEISPSAGMHTNTGAFREGAEDTIDFLKGERSANAGPFYQQFRADNAPVDLTAVLQHIDDRLNSGELGEPGTKVLEKAKSLLTEKVQQPDGTVVVVPKSNASGLFGAKLDIDQMIAGKTSDDNVASAVRLAGKELTETKKLLTEALSNSSDDYATGSRIYATMSPDVEAAQKGLTGAVAKSNQLTDEVLNYVFGKGSQEEIQKMRDQFAIAGRLPQFNAGLRAFIDQSINEAQRNVGGRTGNVANTFLSKFVRTPEDEAKLLAAAPQPNASSELYDLLRVLRRVASTQPEGAPTASDMVGNMDLASKGAKFLAHVANPLNVLHSLQDYIVNSSIKRNAARMADQMTANPLSVARLLLDKTYRPVTSGKFDALGALGAGSGQTLNREYNPGYYPAPSVPSDKTLLPIPAR